jgi:dGTPase
MTQLKQRLENKKQIFPKLIQSFEKWLIAYSDYPQRAKENIIYPIDKNKETYSRCIVDFISSMSDSFAIEMFTELTTF